MTSMPPKLLPLAVVCALSACAGLVGTMGANDEKIKAPHQRHKEADVDCATCHETIFDSTTVEDRDLPKEKVCLGCHKEEKTEKNNCAFCHSKAEPGTYPTRARWVKFNHSTHMERTNEDCSVCHKQLPEPTWTEQVKPTMATCLNCHEHQAQYDKGQCDVCHKDLSVFQLRPVSDYSHQGNWLQNHRLEARSSEANCATCHEQNFCVQCHAAQTVPVKAEIIYPERVDRQFIHRHDFVSRHMVEARADEAMCLRCHSVNTCQQCHAQSGLSPMNPGVDPHPPGFGNGNVHGPAARRDIVQCAACHDQGASSNCVSCHRVGGIAGNPHPAAWTLRHGREEIGRNAMCQVCHQ
jgi:hypothetical protein